jgi:hypothetical protein
LTLHVLLGEEMESITSSAAVSTSGRTSLPTSTALRTPVGQRALLATPKRVRRSSARQDAVAFGAASGFGADDGASSYAMLSQLASATGFVIGALWFGRELALEQERNNEFNEQCMTCRGTGRMPCICQRWSDSDVGCGSCSNTGFAICKDCRGGGTKVPVARAAPIYVDDENKYRQQRGPYDQ